MRPRIVLTAFCSLIALALGPAANAHAVAPSEAEVSLADIDTPLVPTRLLQGDREFGGNGPDITSRVRLELSSDRRSIVAKIYFKARETKSDWSTTEAEWTRTVFTAPGGKRIDRILTPASSEVKFLSKKAGFQILGPGEDFKSFVKELTKLVKMALDAERMLSGRPGDTPEVRKAREIMGKLESATAGLTFEDNYVHVVHPKSGGPVNLFAIVGDTGGDDISKDTNPKDDTRVQAIKFNKVRIRYQ